MHLTNFVCRAQVKNLGDFRRIDYSVSTAGLLAKWLLWTGVREVQQCAP
jgi:hypothetical protein